MTDQAPKLETAIVDVPGIGPVTGERFHKLGIKTIGDLLEHLPRRVEDHSQVVPIKELPFNEERVISGKITRTSTRRSKKGTLIVQADIADDSGKISALWFNQRFLIKMLPVGRDIILYGQKKPLKSLGNPFITKKILPQLGIQPIYPAVSGLYQSKISQIVRSLEPTINQFEDIVPDNIRHDLNLLDRPQAVKQAHFGKNMSDVLEAQKLFAAEEFLALASAIILTKKSRQDVVIAPLPVDGPKLAQFAELLPFKLTDGQRRVAWEIIQDLTQPFPMNRLLYGEVGSGKTAVALMVASVAMQGGQKVVMLTPTLALAHQQADVCAKILAPTGLKVAVVTASKKEEIGSADLIIGTHALLQKNVELKNIGLVIVDEQHRFGVEQRQHLLEQTPKAHLLMMTATPIPRSLAQTIFGHLDISFLAGRPKQQKDVITRVFKPIEREAIEQEIEARLQKNQPGYVIVPLIDEPEAQDDLLALERKTIHGETKRLKEKFGSCRIEILHGRLKGKEKEDIITRFRSGEIDLLLSTTVVEVGIDNPRATWILIEEADRLGLAQLHQLRGRVGRGENESVCYLSDSGLSFLGQQRLQALLETTNGLELAEKDLSLRGPGEMIGEAQSGLPTLRFASWSDTATLKKMFSYAQDIIKDGLEKYPALQEKVEELIKDHEEMGRA